MKAKAIRGPVAPLSEYRLGPHLTLTRDQRLAIGRWIRGLGTDQTIETLQRALDAMDAEHARAAGPITGYEVMDDDKTSGLTLSVQAAEEWSQDWLAPERPGGYSDLHYRVAQALRAAMSKAQR